MATAQEIPLIAQNQTFNITLGGIAYSMAVNWRDAPAGAGGWFLDLSDGTNIVNGIALVTGVDLMEQYGYIDFPGQLWVQSDFDPSAVPTFDNLGSESHLYFVS